MFNLQIFVGKIPRDLFEDELVPLFEKAGPIWDLRLMMDPLTGLNRGYAFVTFCTKEAAQEAVKLVSFFLQSPHSLSLIKVKFFLVPELTKRFLKCRLGTVFYILCVVIVAVFFAWIVDWIEDLYIRHGVRILSYWFFETSGLVIF